MQTSLFRYLVEGWNGCASTKTGMLNLISIKYLGYQDQFANEFEFCFTRDGVFIMIFSSKMIAILSLHSDKSHFFFRLLVYAFSQSLIR